MPQVGSFVFDWRKVHPYTPENAVILHDVPGTLPALRKAFPDRAFFRLERTPAFPFLQLVPVTED
jgi:hypothetical protein